MRQIKFRAWDRHNKVIIEDYCHLEDGRFIGYDCTNNHTGVAHEDIMQFTGRKDHNHKELYVGDYITNSHSITFEIIYMKSLFQKNIGKTEIFMKVKKLSRDSKEV